MAKSGPKPKPTARKILEGNPGKRPLPKREPMPKALGGVPIPPSHLNKFAKREWRRLSKDLYELGLLTAMDLTALEGYCVSYALWVDCQEKIKKHGVIVKSPNGYPIQSPLLTISNKAMIEMRKWLVEFGMTPSSRTRVEATPKKRELDPMEQVLRAIK